MLAHSKDVLAVGKVRKDLCLNVLWIVDTPDGSHKVRFELHFLKDVSKEFSTSVKFHEDVKNVVMRDFLGFKED